mgnify:CR=1 FL=1
MIIPSIDLMGGQAVQLRQGKTLVLQAGDPRPWARRFGLLGEVAVIDLDAAMGKGSNAELIRELCAICRCRVGGGVRDVQTARGWLDAGAAKVILGTRAVPEILEQLPRGRVIAALDARDGEVVVEGWTKGTGTGVIERMSALRPLVGGFLVTFVEIEGTLSGLDPERARPLLEAAGDARLTVAGGVKTVGEIAALDRMGADAQIGMALYQGLIDPADALAATLTTDRADGLWPTVIVDERGVALGLAYSSAESLRLAVAEQRGIYHSRTRGLWRKGESSGATQELLRIDADCDRDALRFTVRQAAPGFCHRQTHTCWGQAAGLGALEATLTDPATVNNPASYTARLLREAGLLDKKIIEEAGELTLAADRGEIAQEAADVLYFTLVKLAAAGVSLAEVERVLDRRALKVSRRGGEAKLAAPTTAPRAEEGR